MGSGDGRRGRETGRRVCCMAQDEVKGRGDCWPSSLYTAAGSQNVVDQLNT
jgi:hypothetical protein